MPRRPNIYNTKWPKCAAGCRRFGSTKKDVSNSRSVAPSYAKRGRTLATKSGQIPARVQKKFSIFGWSPNFAIECQNVPDISNEKCPKSLAGPSAPRQPAQKVSTSRLVAQSGDRNAWRWPGVQKRMHADGRIDKHMHPTNKPARRLPCLALFLFAPTHARHAGTHARTHARTRARAPAGQRSAAHSSAARGRA